MQPPQKYRGGLVDLEVMLPLTSKLETLHINVSSTRRAMMLVRPT